MVSAQPIRRIGSWRTTLDVALILALGILAESAHFTWRQGRHLICADSVQYVDGAEALLSTDKTPHFEFRKPGYSLVLAATALVLGNMAWGAVVLNYLAQALLPLAVYCLGRNLRSRLTGWMAAILVIAQLQFQYRAERIMSEPVYTTILTFAILFFVVALSGRRQICWLLVAGASFGAAWLIRSIAIVAIGAALICLVWTQRKQLARAAVLCACMLLPITGAVFTECALNGRYAGLYRPGTGTFGLLMAIRLRALDGVTFPQTDTAKWCLDLLPDRSPDEAYLANKLDGWVAWYRAIHDRGMDEWDFDRRIRSVAVEMIAHQPVAYAASSLKIFTRHLLRQSNGRSVSRVPAERRRPVLLPAGVAQSEENRQQWYRYWALPHRSQQEAARIVSRMQAGSDEGAPFGHDGVWAELRYWSMLPIVGDFLGVLRGIGRLWPGFALIMCGMLGLNRRTCAFLALSYVFDAAVVGLCSISDTSNARFQYVWLATDTTLAAALITPIAQAVCVRVGAWLPAWMRRRSPVPKVSHGFPIHVPV